MKGVIGTILAGGMSTRMGEPKHALRLPDGRTMIEHVAGALRQACQRLVIVSSEETMPGVEHIADNFDQLGPIGGIEALLGSGIGENFLIVPCDMPLLTADILHALLVNTVRPATALRVGSEPAARTLPLRLSTALLPLIWSRIEEGELSIRGLLEAAEVEVVLAPADWEPALANINTPEEFDRLARSQPRPAPPMQ